MLFVKKQRCLLIWLLLALWTLPKGIHAEDPAAAVGLGDKPEQPEAAQLPLQHAVSPDSKTQHGTSREASNDYARGAELYDKAVHLIGLLRTRSVSIVPPPSTSLFSPSSYTPLLDLIETAGSGPLASVIKYARKILSGSSTAQRMQQLPPDHDGIEEDETGWSLLGAMYKMFGASRLLGDLYDADSGTLDLRTKKLISALSSGGQIGKAEVKFGLRTVAELLEQAGTLGKDEAWEALGDLSLWGRYGAEQNLTTALRAYEKLADRTGSPSAQHHIGFLKSTGLAEGMPSEGDQSTALLYYTFAALGGLPEAEMTVGYRHWVGIGTKQSCGDALPFYKSAADKAMKKFNSGPPGGLNLPPAKLRLSDLDGGVYGQGASVSTAGPHSAAHKHHHHHGMNAHHPTTEQEWEDVLEFYTFHADRGDAGFMFRLGRVYYQGFGSSGIIRSLDSPYRSLHPDELGGRDYARALKWFTRIARSVWPRDPQAAVKKPPGTQVIASYDAAKDVKAKVDDHQFMVAALAAGYLGRMHLRGEGVPQDYTKAFLWFNRGLAQGDHTSHNGLGIMYRDGLGVPVDMQKSSSFFQAASGENFAEAQVNLGRMHLAKGEYGPASHHFDHAVKHGDSFQAFYYLAELNAHAVARPDLCPVAVSFYKIVAERGDWSHEIWNEAERAWARGDRQRALLGYWMMAERGYEVAQNNVAYILDRDKSRLRLPSFLKVLQPPPGPLVNTDVTDRLALVHWTRSAAQDNTDALIKLGDYYLKGIGLPNGSPQPHKAAACYQTAASTHVSSLALHSLGWMHEAGIGVNKDFHLAKRYYDLALETNSEAYLPVVLSLLKLHARSVYQAITKGDIHGITNPFLQPTEKDVPLDQRSLSPQERLYLAFHHFINFRFRQGFTDLLGGGHPRGRASAEDNRPLGDEAPADQTQPPTNPLLEAQRALTGKEDPVQFARDARERERELARDADSDDDYYLRAFTGDGDVLESLTIIFLCMAVGWLVYYRQARLDAARAAQEEERRRQAQQHQEQRAP